MNTRTGFYMMATIFVFVILTSCGEKAIPEEYKIRGSINGVSAGSVKLVRNNPADRSSTTVDSVGFSSGEFTLKGKADSAEMMNLVIEPGNWIMPVFVENGEIQVKADTSNSEHFDWTGYGGSKGANIKTYSITGSENQENWMKYENNPTLKKFEPEFKRLQEAYAGAAADKEKAYLIKNEMDSLRRIYTAVQIQWIDSFVKANPSSAAGAYILNNYYMFNEDLPLNQMEALVGQFTGPAKQTVYYKILSEAVAKRQALLPGNTAPDFSLLKPDSSSLALSSLRGKYVMLDFWASWCVPCRKAIPHWKDVYAKYHDKGFEILSVTNDSRWSDWHKAIQEEKMPWMQVADEFPVKNMPARVAELYMIPYLPTYVLIDQKGKIVLHGGSEEEITNKLKEIFGS